MYIIDKLAYCPKCGSHHFDKNSEKSRHCDNCGFEWFMNASSANVAFILNDRGELLVERRKCEPGKGTLDLPGGFADVGETAEEGLVREVREETGLTVTHASYIFSLPNVYHYGDEDVPTLDLFFRCEVESTDCLEAADDAAECMWLRPEDIHTELFGLRSVRWGLSEFLKTLPRTDAGEQK